MTGVAVGSGLVDAEFVRLGESLSRRRARDGGRVLARARRVAATVACALPALRSRTALAELPHLEVQLSRTPAGDRMAEKYAGRRQGVPRRLAVSVLTVPAEQADYLRGRSRQALRTNSRKAREAGVVCRPLGRDEAAWRLSSLLAERDEYGLVAGVLADLETGLCTAWLAEDADGHTEAAALTTRDGSFGRLDLMLSTPGGEASPARYLLSAHLVGALGAAGVRHLAVDNALFLHSGLRHFQQLLGFAPTTLDVVRVGAPSEVPDPRTGAAPEPVRRRALV